MNKQKGAFTLVELIVTIMILAILGTIAFISMQGYSKSSRDSVRVSDLSTMKTSLELFHLESGKYPDPTEPFSVNYSGALVWSQGTFGESTKNNVDKLDKIPKDPLTDVEYTYSITNTKQEYQLGGMMEDSLIVSDTISAQTYAGDILAIAIVTGNYNGQTLKTQIGELCEVLSVPTIISGDSESITDLEEIIENERLVYNGYNNLPSNYESSRYKPDGGFGFISDKLVVYSDTDECALLYSEEDPTARIDLIKNLRIAYNGTIIENEDNIKGLVLVNVDDFESINLLGSTIVNNNLGGNIVSSKATTVSCGAGFHTEDLVNCIENTETLQIENGTNLNTWNGDHWELTLLTCDTDFYNNGDDSCSPVGNGFFSNSTDLIRTACTNTPDTASRNYTYTSSGNGTNNCNSSYTDLCGVDLYETSNGTCSAVGTGYYSTTSSNTRTACTNDPDTASRNYSYTSDGNGTNSCGVSYTDLCGLDLYETSNGTCSVVGTGYYSTTSSNIRTACTNKPSGSSYTGVGNGSNACTWSCNSGYYQSGSSCYAYSYGRVVGGRGSCSVTCGGGVMYRSVRCRRNDGTYVSDGYCSSKPSTSASCNTQSCGTPRTHGNDGSVTCNTLCAWGSGWCTGFSAGSCGTIGVVGTCYCRK